MPWDPQQYHRFQRERAAPFDDALALVTKRDGITAVDLGCGTGELTRRLADALTRSDMTGIDSSSEMLSKASAHAREGLRFTEGNLATVDGRWDLVFSHAAIQWVDDHDALVPRLFSLVKPGGQLVVQLPSNQSHPTHTLIVDIARSEPFATALGGWTRAVPVLSIDRYAELLYRAGAESITVFEKAYPHVLPDADALAEWTSGTALVPYFERLGGLREAFMERYREALRERFPESPVFYPFRRTLFSATRPL